MLSYQEFSDLMEIARRNSRFEGFQFEAAKYVDFTADEGDLTVRIVWKMKYSHLNIRSIRGVAQLSQAEFAEKYGISRRSIESWEGEYRHPPEYLVNLLAFAVYADAIKAGE